MGKGTHQPPGWTFQGEAASLLYEDRFLQGLLFHDKMAPHQSLGLPTCKKS